MRTNSRMIAITLFAIVTVEFGGWSLLGMLTSSGAITEFEEQFFRAGHAHAGVLLTLALVYFVLMDRTDFDSARQRLLGLTLLIGILLQSGGFFLHMLVGAEAESSSGTLLTRIGAVLLAVALIGLGVGVLKAGGTRRMLQDSPTST
jgi:fucose 4-O-acetylase-like acetyltransferase